MRVSDWTVNNHSYSYSCYLQNVPSASQHRRLSPARMGLLLRMVFCACCHASSCMSHPLHCAQKAPMSPSAASAHVVVVPPRCVVQHLHLHARLRPRYNCLQTTPRASLHASPHLHRVRLHSLLLRRPHARSRIFTCCSLRRACNTSCGSCNTSCGAFVPPGRNGWRVELSRRPPGGARARDDFGGPPRQPRGEFR